MNNINKIISENKIPVEEQIENLISIAEDSLELSKPKLKQGMMEVKTVIFELKQAIDSNNIVKANSVLDHL